MYKICTEAATGGVHQNIGEQLLLFAINKEFGILVNDCIIQSWFRIVLCGLV